MNIDAIDITGRIIKGFSEKEIHKALITTYGPKPLLLTFVVRGVGGRILNIKMSITAFWYENSRPYFRGIATDGRQYMSEITLINNRR